MRNRMFTPRTLWVAVVVCALFLAGCGEKQGASPTATSTKPLSAEEIKQMQARSAAQEAAMRESDAKSRAAR